MEAKDAKLGQAVFFVSDEYDDDLRINRPILMQGIVKEIDEEYELLTVEWVENPTDEDEDQGACFFFPTKEEAISDYIQRHTEDLIQQALLMGMQGA